MKRLVLASSNAGKLRELSQILAGRGLDVVPQSDFTRSAVAETGSSFVENALLKARHACRASGLAAIADDSGLEVDALNGAPGIYSARFAGPDADDRANLTKLLEALRRVPTAARGARFQCLIVLLRHARDPTPLICQGTWEGRILDSPRGENGFGYDPVFYVPDYVCSAAQLPAATKNRISHRGQALQQLLERIADLRE